MTTPPLNLVDVLEQLPPEVVGTMVMGQLDGDDIRSFKLAAPTTLALVRRTSRVLRLWCRGPQDRFPGQKELESQVEIFRKHEACMEVQLDVDADTGAAAAIVGTSISSTEPRVPGNVRLECACCNILVPGYRCSRNRYMGAQQGRVGTHIHTMFM